MMAPAPSPEKITARHRERAAYVYVRQSTPRQVQHNRESQGTSTRWSSAPSPWAGGPSGCR